MPDFNVKSPYNNQKWYAYYCDNVAYETDEKKNNHFLEYFLNEAQRERVIQEILAGAPNLDALLTQYRKITLFFLKHLPDMAFSVPGWSCSNQYKPLLVSGRVGSSNGRMDHQNTLRLHHLFDGDIGFILTYSSLNDNNPDYDGLPHNPNITNPLENKRNLIPGAYLGPITLAGNGNISTDQYSSDALRGFLEEFNIRQKENHFKNFTKNWGHLDPYIPRLLDGDNGVDLDYIPRPEPKTLTMNNLNIILYGPPGTGKTYELSARAIKIIDGANNNESRDKINERFSELQRQGRIEFTTFHQNYAYEDFIEGLRAEYKEKSVVYDIEPGILKRIAYRALYAWLKGEEADFEKDPTQKDIVLNYLRSGVLEHENKPENIPNYVLIIDEINRGNVARIFGELITLVEDSKRSRRPEEAGNGHQPLLATLPYTKEPFILPPNLYLIGTMNTADRSLIGLDAALRRRFFFEEMPPKPQELENRVIDGANLENFLTQLNQRIVARDVRDHCIGHAYFMEVNTLDDLANVMRYKVIPQLQEYFHDSPGDLHQLLQFGNDSFVDQNGQTKEEYLADPARYQAFIAHA